MHETAYGKMRHQQSIELLFHQFRGLAPKNDLRPSQMRLKFVERGLDLPSLVIQGRQFLGGSVRVVQDSVDEAADRIGVRNVVHVIVDHPHCDGVAIFSPVRHRRVDTAEVGAVRQRPVTDLGKGAGAAAGSRPPKRLFVFGGVSGIERTSVQTDNAPPPIPGALGPSLGDQ